MSKPSKQSNYILPTDLSDTDVTLIKVGLKKFPYKTGQWVRTPTGQLGQVIVRHSILGHKLRIVVKPAGTPLKMWTRYFSFQVQKGI